MPGFKHRRIVSLEKYSTHVSDLFCFSDGETITATEAVSASLAVVGTGEGHTNAITGIDWSSSGEYMRSSGGSSELLVWDANRGDGLNLTERASALRNEEWATCTSLVGWDVQGIWKQKSDDRRVVILSGSHTHKEICGMKMRAAILAGDACATIRLMQHPTLGRVEAKEFKAHSAACCSLDFSFNDQIVVSASVAKHELLIWKTKGFHYDDVQSEVKLSLRAAEHSVQRLKSMKRSGLALDSIKRTKHRLSLSRRRTSVGLMETNGSVANLVSHRSSLPPETTSTRKLSLDSSKALRRASAFQVLGASTRKLSFDSSKVPRRASAFQVLGV